ncbi:MAG: phosphoribosylformylglycinamidine synthase, partial [Phascolarctobacterium sp.]|nr:phosphoribosylformylglycinamidine synthase [Candidatus Phascolarctobacterium caballi]
TTDSLTNCGAEVQKGNANTERKLQRLFRNQEVTTMIKRCNDFGAGGVSVAIGELTDGLEINLDLVPKKYEGLDGTELAISESQERMAVVIAAENRDRFISFADKENLEATVVADVTDTGRLVMYWQGDKIVDLSRAFLDTNGVPQHTIVEVIGSSGNSVFTKIPNEVANENNLLNKWLANLSRLNVCSQKGLVERFDSTIGRGTVQMPFGGKMQLTPSEGMVGRIPVLHGKTDAVSIMACGYSPDVACWSPFHGGMYAVTESVVRAVALGADPDKIRLTLQEYFPKLHDSSSWGDPFSALLGAFAVTDALELPPIGGKDSMSGTFMDKTVPPTLVSFAVGVTEGRYTVSADFKKAGNQVVFLSCPRNGEEVLDFAILRKNLRAVHQAIKNGKIASAGVVKDGGLAALVSVMGLGNQLGFEFADKMDENMLFTLQPGGMVVELADGDAKDVFADIQYTVLGKVIDKPEIHLNGQVIPQKDALQAYEGTLQGIFPNKLMPVAEITDIKQPLYKNKLPLTASVTIAKPRVFIPVFPGTNCEYDSAAAFKDAGAVTDTLVIRNLTPSAIEESVQAMVKYINNSQIVMFPGGFSAGDEPDGSGKFIATMLRNPRIKEAILNLLNERDGLMLGICNGFQALIKLGLVPYGEIRDMEDNSPTLTFNEIGRHISQIVRTKVVSNKSPWFAACEPGEEHAVAVSHGEGRFYAPENIIKELFANGQVATQYVNLQGEPTMNTPFNPNGSLYAIEGITSLDGRILGKMGHSERYTDGLYRNIEGNKDQKLFVSGINYFK